MYFFKLKKGIIKGYEQYPSGSLNTLIKDTDPFLYISEKFLVRRIDTEIYYFYLCPLNKKEILGVCVKGNKLCTDFELLLMEFRGIVENVFKEKIIVQKVGRMFSFKQPPFQKDRVLIDIFLRNNNISVDGKSINAATLSISKNDKVECNFEDRGSAWIVEQLTEGYHKIDISFSEKFKYKNENPKPQNFKWGWKTWSLFLILIGIIASFLYIIHSNQLESKFRYALERIIL